jgi:hypothetical protein
MLLNAMQYICMRETSMNPFEFDHVEWLMEREASEAGLDREARLARVEHGTAEDIFDRVKDYCEHSSDEWPRCMADHSPDKFDEFVNKYLNGEEAEDLKRFIEENSDVYKSPEEFWNEVKIVYEALWLEWMTTEIAKMLKNVIWYSMSSIYLDPKLSYSCKIKRLKAYADVLNKFRKAIQRALNKKKPLSKEDLYYWFTDLGAINLKADQDYYNMVNYWLSYYDKFDDYGKLDVLEILLNEMDELFSTINERLNELEELTNQN